MSEALYRLMGIIARIHNYIMHLNDRFEYNFSDKALHFLVIGVLGIGLIFVVYPLFKWLAQKKHIMAIAWIYVFTLILVITFAIEIGQKISGTGNMEFDDIVFGMPGFFTMFAAFVAVRGVYHGVRWLIKHRMEADGAHARSERDKERTEDGEETVYDTIRKEADTSDKV